MDALINTLATYGPVALMGVLWCALAGLVGLSAGRRGYNAFVWFLASLLISPIAGLVLLVLVTPSGGPRRPV